MVKNLPALSLLQVCKANRNAIGMRVWSSQKPEAVVINSWRSARRWALTARFRKCSMKYVFMHFQQ